jgi:transcription antitermination factor NusG
MTATKSKVQCGECFNLFAPSYMRRKPDTGKRVCRTCFGELKEQIAAAQPPAPTEQMHHFLMSTRGVLGVLPLKPALFGRRYARKEPPAIRKPKAWEKEKAEAWRPTAMATYEAARLLISQAVGEKAKDAPLDFGVGDRVVITDGPFKTMVGPVLEITGEGKSRKAKVSVSMWGRPLEVDVEHWQCKKEV